MANACFQPDLYTGWYGSYKQLPVEMGACFYMVQYRSGSGEEEMLKGDVLLIR
jgi:hypothetical protein